MKKEYKKPQTCTVKLMQQEYLQTGSPETLTGTPENWVEIE